MKEIQWKLIAQCLAGTLSGMAGGIAGFSGGYAAGLYIFNNYEIGPFYGVIIGVVAGSLIGTTIFRKIKWKNYKNISLTEIILTLAILITPVMSQLVRTDNASSFFIVATAIFVGFALIPSIIITIGTYFFEKNHKSP